MFIAKLLVQQPKTRMTCNRITLGGKIAIPIPSFVFLLLNQTRAWLLQYPNEKGKVGFISCLLLKPHTRLGLMGGGEGNFCAYIVGGILRLSCLDGEK